MEALREAGVPFRENEPFARHTTMGVGGPAAVMAFPRSADELRTTLRVRGELGVPHRVLGGGSNLVVVDEGLDELVINTENLKAVAMRDDGVVTAEGGANLIRTVVSCCRAGWRGLESACGIPGSVGGAAVMNAGAYGFSISDVMTRDRGLRRERRATGSPPTAGASTIAGSSIPEGSAVAEIAVKLRADDAATLEKETGELSRQRTKSQPGGRNAGCVFKNPEGAPGGEAHRRAWASRTLGWGER